MPKREGSVKSEYIGTRVISPVKESVFREALTEGLTPSEWLRNLIVKELKEREALPRGITISDRFAGSETAKLKQPIPKSQSDH